MEKKIRLTTPKIMEDYVPNVILKAFKEKYASLFSKYDREFPNPYRFVWNLDDKISNSCFHSGMTVGLEWYPKMVSTEEVLLDDCTNFRDLFLSIYEWSKSKVAYHYPDDTIKQVGNIDDMPFKAEYFVEMPFHSFYLEFKKDWNIHGILINIVENPVYDSNKRAFWVNAIVLCDEETLDSLNLAEANISFLITEGDTYGSFYPDGSTDSIMPDYFEERNGELQYSILYMCYLLYKISHERNLVPTIGKVQHKKETSNDTSGEWDTEHRIVYDDLKSVNQELKTFSTQNVRLKENAENQTTKLKKKRKSPRPHLRAGTKGHRWCGSGKNKYLKEVWIKGSFPNGKKGNGEIPVVERRKKEDSI